jgi:hypothetical protein
VFGRSAVTSKALTSSTSYLAAIFKSISLMPELLAYFFKGISFANEQDNHQGETNVILSLEGKITDLQINSSRVDTSLL